MISGPLIIRRPLAILFSATETFSRIDGGQRAAAFAHYAFFSLFPLIVLFVTIASVFIDRDRAGTEIIAFVQSYLPLDSEKKSFIFDTVSGVVGARKEAGVVAFLTLSWAAMRFFSTLIRATNRAWDVEAYKWWRLPLKSLVFLVLIICAALIGVAMPVLAKTAQEWFLPANGLGSLVFYLGGILIPLLIVFTALTLFYKLAPRRPTRFSEVWIAALSATILFQAAELLFVVYLKNFSVLNAVYGAFGGIMALLLWIYLSGCIFIFGACLCAAQAEGRAVPTKAPACARVSGGRA